MQLCTGREAGYEVAKHEIFDNNKTEVIVFVDADNAFNTINHRHGSIEKYYFTILNVYVQN